MNPRLRQIVSAAPLLLAVMLAFLILETWVARLTYPYDLEWMEGGMLVHAWRLQQGLPQYPDAGREFIPFIYPAGYASLLALLGEVFGLGHALGRAVSATGTLAAAVAIAYAVRVHGASLRLGLVGAAIFLGCYRFSGAFYDLVRLDGLTMGLVAWAVVLGLQRRRGAVIASAFLLSAAFLVKQHVALLGLPIALGVGLRDGWRAAFRFALCAALPCLAVTGYLQWVTGGRYLTWVLGVPAAHGMVGGRIFPGTPRELGLALGFVLPIAAAWVALRTAGPPGAQTRRSVLSIVLVAAVTGAVLGVLLPRVHGMSKVWPIASALGVGGVFAAIAAGLLGFWGGIRSRQLSWRYAYGVGVGGVVLVASALMRGHVGGFMNVHIPLHWVVALGGTLAVARWQQRRPGWTAILVGEGLLGVQMLYLLAMFLRGDPLVPDDADRAAGDAFVAALEEAPGPVLSPFNPWLAVQAGHEPGWHLIALWDINHRRCPMRHGVEDVKAAIEEGYWPTFVDGSRRMKFGVPDHYDVGVEVIPDRHVFTPKTGWRARPARIKAPVSE